MSITEKRDATIAGYKEAKKQINSTGYSPIQVAQIEHACENVTNDPDGFLGLMAVVDVLQEIHGVDTETTEVAKERFVTA